MARGQKRTRKSSVATISPEDLIKGLKKSKIDRSSNLSRFNIKIQFQSEENTSYRCILKSSSIKNNKGLYVQSFKCIRVCFQQGSFKQFKTLLQVINYNMKYIYPTLTGIFAALGGFASKNLLEPKFNLSNQYFDIFISFTLCILFMLSFEFLRYKFYVKSFQRMSTGMSVLVSFVANITFTVYQKVFCRVFCTKKIQNKQNYWYVFNNLWNDFNIKKQEFKKNQLIQQ